MREDIDPISGSAGSSEEGSSKEVSSRYKLEIDVSGFRGTYEGSRKTKKFKYRRSWMFAAFGFLASVGVHAAAIYWNIGTRPFAPIDPQQMPSQSPREIPPYDVSVELPQTPKGNGNTAGLDELQTVTVPSKDGVLMELRCTPPSGFQSEPSCRIVKDNRVTPQQNSP
ncbi:MULTISPECIES: hypothetical protein [unclassified Bradyrhizobium]|uniref:hypothetical protein n=1 Tax=unclassified Bradyrhizobium TaxID=2631580 RepID=UPI0028EE99BD|nr:MULTISPECIES: hypothetical protein [unclassified Bradyrhizobium]